MKKILNKVIIFCYGLVVYCLTPIVGIILFAYLYGVVEIMTGVLLHIITKHNFQFGDLLKPKVFSDWYTYESITYIFIWRLTLDIGTVYRIIDKFKIKWYKPLENRNFIVGIMSHFFAGIPEADYETPYVEKHPFPSNENDPN